MTNKTSQPRLPRWMKAKFPMGEEYIRVKKLIQSKGLHTICSSGNCPNAGECWGNGTATFMLLGDTCTRNCRFCGVPGGNPSEPDMEEPERVAESVFLMKLKHVVITSVTRDDLPDEGATLWAQTIRTVKKRNPKTTIEVLIPDFNAREDLIQQVIDAAPEVISHNLETVERLTPIIRSKAAYRRSLRVLQYIAEQGIITKSGIMLGLGESQDEVLTTMDDLRQVESKVMTLGQYLCPSKDNVPVKEFITPEQFEFYHKEGLAKGFQFVESSPLVRSSYHAEKHVACK
jgi:lipoyl synthase